VFDRRSATSVKARVTRVKKIDIFCHSKLAAEWKLF